jgi:hypothetical protein
MKYIKKYATDYDFFTAGNHPGFVYYVNLGGFNNENHVSYSIVQPSLHSSGDKQLQYKGSVQEITPGVAYVNESGTTYYNGPSLPRLEFTAVSSITHYTWAELGITEEIYQKYVELVKSYSHPGEFNILYDGNMDIRNIEWDNNGGYIEFRLHNGYLIDINYRPATDTTEVVVSPPALD